MNRTFKILLVLGGYVLAFLIALGGAVLQSVLKSADITQGSPGMSAFGDLMFFMGAFALLCVPPTLLGLWFLRKSTLFWNLAAGAVLAFAFTAPLAEGTRSYIQWAGLYHDWGVWVDLVALLRTFGTPILAIASGLCAFIAPTPKTRWALCLAAAIESGTAFYIAMLIHFHHRFC